MRSAVSDHGDARVGSSFSAEHGIGFTVGMHQRHPSGVVTQIELLPRTGKHGLKGHGNSLALLGHVMTIDQR
jgi:hypothetical protein